MSGPKYYRFPANSSEEAAGILSRFSAFQHGVKATIEGNEITVTVSSEAWLNGKDYDFISKQIADATARFHADEKMRKLLEDGKSKELQRVSNLKAQISKQAEYKKKKYMDSQNHCMAIERLAEVSINTPFGNYDMKAYIDKCKKLMSQIRSEIDGVDTEKNLRLSNCDTYSSQIRHCSSLSELSSAKKKAPDMSISQTFTNQEVESLETEIKERKKQLLEFTQFLREMDQVISSKGLVDYRPRIVKALENMDIYSPDSIRELEKLVKQIEREHAYMQEQLIIKKADEATLKEVEAQIALLGNLKSLLKPLVENAEVYTEAQINYENLGHQTLANCEKIIAQIDGLKFCSNIHRAEIEKAKQVLDRSRPLLRLPNVYTQLVSLHSRLNNLNKECIKEVEDYEKFSVEYERYKELYMKFRGILTAEESKLVDDEGYIEEPENIAFDNFDAKTQISILIERNKQLELIINQSVQQTFSAGMSAILYGSKWGREFKREKNEDGSTHLLYMRKADKGAIFDVSCKQDGKVEILPRGVILSNGRATITADDLRKVHASCQWAEEISEAFESVGIPNGEYEEMADEYREKLYDTSNYYRMKTEAESIRFLLNSGFSEEEIAALGYKIEKDNNAVEKEVNDQQSSQQEAIELKP